MTSPDRKCRHFSGSQQEVAVEVRELLFCVLWAPTGL